MYIKEFSNILYTEENREPAEEELVNVIINSILCGDINFEKNDSVYKIETRLERIFNLDDLLRANYLIKNNKQDWDNFINEYPPSVPTEVSKFMENHKSMALVIWLLNARGVINLENGKYLFPPVPYNPRKIGKNRIRTKGFSVEDRMTSDYLGFLEMWKRLGCPNVIQFANEKLEKDYAAMVKNKKIAALKEANKEVKEQEEVINVSRLHHKIGNVLKRCGFSTDIDGDLNLWDVCDFFSKVSILVALKRPNPTNHEVYKKPILEIVDYLFPNFHGACALFYLKKCKPVKLEDIKNQVKYVSEDLTYYVNRKRPEPQQEDSTSDVNSKSPEPQQEDSTSDVNSKSPKPQQKVKLYHPSVIKLLQENVHYTEIDFPEGTPLNWMPVQEESQGDSNSHSTSWWKIDFNNPRVLFKFIKGLENYPDDIINRETDTASDQEENSVAPVINNNVLDNQAMEIEDAPGQNVAEIGVITAPVNEDDANDNHSIEIEDAPSQDELEIDASAAQVNEDDANDNHSIEIEDAPSQDELEIDASAAQVNEDDANDNHSIEIEDAPGQNGAEINASDAPVDDVDHMNASDGRQCEPKNSLKRKNDASMQPTACKKVHNSIGEPSKIDTSQPEKENPGTTSSTVPPNSNQKQSTIQQGSSVRSNMKRTNASSTSQSTGSISQNKKQNTPKKKSEGAIVVEKPKTVGEMACERRINDYYDKKVDRTLRYQENKRNEDEKKKERSRIRRENHEKKKMKRRNPQIDTSIPTRTLIRGGPLPGVGVLSNLQRTTNQAESPRKPRSSITAPKGTTSKTVPSNNSQQRMNHSNQASMTSRGQTNAPQPTTHGSTVPASTRVGSAGTHHSVRQSVSKLQTITESPPQDSTATRRI